MTRRQHQTTFSVAFLATAPRALSTILASASLLREIHAAPRIHCPTLAPVKLSSQLAYSLTLLNSASLRQSEPAGHF